MSSPYSLRLIPEPAAPGQAAPLPEVDFPEVHEEAGLLINHGLLAAEILGIETGEVTWRLDAVWAVPAEVLRAFDDEDAAVMAELFGRVEAALGESLDDEGAPRGELGERLLRSDLVACDRGGRPYFRSHRMLLTDLRHSLAFFRRYLSFAAEHGLWLLIE